LANAAHEDPDNETPECHDDWVNEGSTKEASRILLIEDDRELGEMLVELFAAEGYATDLAVNGQRGLHLGLSRSYQIIIVDRGLPAIDGLDIVVRLRRRSVDARILMLTAMGGTADRVGGLDAGADDYLTKPFEVVELLARIRALGRRSFDDAETIPLGSGQLDLGRRGVQLSSGDQVTLSAREFELIRSLAARPRAVHSRTQLRNRVFGDATSESIVDTYVHYLRRKLGRSIVRTIHGVGYQIGSL
jgi:two-component system response regulator QseB